jgi:hypothetical protein
VVLFAYGGVLSSKAFALHYRKQGALQQADHHHQTQPMELLFRHVLLGSLVPDTDILFSGSVPEYTSRSNACFCVSDARFGDYGQNFQDENHLI